MASQRRSIPQHVILILIIISLLAYGIDPPAALVPARRTAPADLDRAEHLVVEDADVDLGPGDVLLDERQRRGSLRASASAAASRRRP